LTKTWKLEKNSIQKCKNYIHENKTVQMLKKLL